ncbi:MAG: carboxypeptidase regulatory-like domain-containing protein [Acidobacteria bacterium]|nr:carboxypeptidase regulatory-like domain-containing protein [Acidobacteriota bacterium]
MKSRLIVRTLLAATLLAMVFAIAVSAQSDDRYMEGIVQSPNGALFSSVWVIVAQNGGEKGRSLTGDDGRYYINNLNDGAYDLAVYRGNSLLKEEQVNLRADSRRHDILIR